jgi:pyruvate-formate lyase
MKKGITAAINSCTSIDFTDFNGGASTMWDLDPSWATEEIIEAIFATFFKQGGQIYQGNATDVLALLSAQENPEDYFNLIVRVGGFSARFVALDKALQNEIIGRVRHK